MNQFSQKVSEILAFSREEAQRLASRSVGPEHLMLGILREKDGPVVDMIQQSKIDTLSIKKELESKVRQDDLLFPITPQELVLNEKANNILKLAVLEARIQSSSVVEQQHLLLAILHDQNYNGAREVLENNNLTYDDAIIYLSPVKTKDGISVPQEEEEDEPASGSSSTSTAKQSDNRSKSKSKTPVLDAFCTDLTDLARLEKLDPVVGRAREIERVTEILCRRKKNNPVLIGEPGVGKSAIVEGLAQMINKKHTSPVLYNKRLVALDMTAVVAGTKYRGQFEERIKSIIKELEQNPDIIVFIDEIHTIIGAGSAAGTMDAANILKPALARGAIQCIGATTLNEYRNSIEKDGALERRFQKVIVNPTTSEETIEILHNIKDRYEEHHHVKYSEDAILSCVKLSDRYISDRFFPDKAIDVMDEVGARVHLRNATIPPEISAKENEIADIVAKKQQAARTQNYEKAAEYRSTEVQLEQELKEMQRHWMEQDRQNCSEVGEAQVAEVVSMMTGVPVQRMAEAESERLRHMAERLQQDVIAQDKAIEKMVKAIQRNRVGLRSPNHPIGAFMFLGPTGVGKTYLAKKLAEEMFGSEDALIRVDMSEYSESFNTSRLVGAPPGYVGYEEGGLLTERVRRKPYSIVLLDEIEKAHGNVFNMLLQVLDEGRLTDGNGRLIDFRNTVIIMTSNTGTRQLKEFGHGVGFTAGGFSDTMNDKDKEYARSIIQKSLARQFAPEFLNRLDEIITFDQLDLDAIKRIIDIELRGLTRRIEEMGYHMQLTDEAKEFVAKKGYDVQYGARPLKRAIQTYVEDLVCERLLDGDLAKGDTVTLGLNGDQLAVKLSRGEE